MTTLAFNVEVFDAPGHKLRQSDQQIRTHMMHYDQYGLEFTAASDAAADLYRQAITAFLAAQHTTEPLLDQLLGLDPDSGVGRIALARLRQSQGRGEQARLPQACSA